MAFVVTNKWLSLSFNFFNQSTLYFMKVIVKNSLLTLLCVVTAFFASCRKDDVEEIIPHPPIDGDEFTIIKSGANDTIYADMQPRVVFNYKQGETYKLGDTGLE